MQKSDILFGGYYTRMRFGKIYLYCPICGMHIEYNQSIPLSVHHHKEFGIVCNESCFRKAELKYARMILGKDDE